MIIQVIFIVAIALSVCTYGQESAQMKFPTTPYWSLAGVYGSAIIADGVTTQGMLHRGCYELWSVGLYGQYPSNTRFYLVSGGIALGTMLVSHKLVGSRHKIARLAGWGLLGWQTQERVHAAIHNTGLNCR